MTTVYVIFGDHFEKIAQYLSDQFKIVGFSRTLEEASVAVEKIKEKPDVFLILGSAMVTGMVDGVVNYNAVLLEHLKKIRLSCPESSIKLIISEKAGKSLIEGIVALAIYDIYKADKINVEDLPQIIMTKKTIANYSDDIQLKLKTMQEKSVKESIKVISQDKEKRQTLVQRLKSINLFNHEDKDEVIKAADEALYRVKRSGRGRVESASVDKNMLHKKITIPEDPLVAVCNGGTDAIMSLVKSKVKKPLTIIDADLENASLAFMLGVNPNRIWQHDWRLGLAATPAKISKKVRYYGMDKELEETLEERDVRCLKEIINAQRDQKIKVIVNLGARQDLLQHLSDMDFKILQV